jgi:cytochrome c
MKRIALFALVALIGCGGTEKRQTVDQGGNSDHGKQLVSQYGCTTCHYIPGVEGPRGMVGPSLEHMASRNLMANKFPNSAEMMIRWLQNPQSLDPQSSMPNVGVTPADARDMAAYLATLK